ncbi:ferritin-like domain-containing protein [Amylostereum chailletii]|nr:ferritin-like domain-containing protein [Amylostereum chailletii]
MRFASSFSLLLAAVLAKAGPAIFKRQDTSSISASSISPSPSSSPSSFASIPVITPPTTITASSSVANATSSAVTASTNATSTALSFSVTAGTPVPSASSVTKPSGGIGFTTEPAYKPLSDFDTQSLNLALHQEYIELDLFRHGLAIFNESQFSDAGLHESDIALLAYMAEQEVGHAELISNIVGPNATQQCTYQYPNFTTVRDYIDFSRLVTRFGESGTLGFLGHLDAQDVASLVQDSIATEGRQQMVFRQWEGLFPMPFWFTTSITQSMQWTLLAPYISSCPQGTPNLTWTNFPALNISDNPYWPDLPLDNSTLPAVAQNVTSVTFPGREVQLQWEEPGKVVGFNQSLITKSFAKGEAQASITSCHFVAWISQLNTTYTPLNNVNGTTGTTTQPGGGIYGDNSTALLNGTVYLLITDAIPYVTPYNLSEIEAHIIAGPALYNVG